MATWRAKLWTAVLLFGLLLGCAPSPAAFAEDAVEMPVLAFREVKLKGDDFMVLQAMEDVELGSFWLGYSSSEPLEALTPEYPLADVSVAAGQAVLLVGGEAIPACDAVYALEMPTDLAETKGTVALWYEERTNGGRDMTYLYVDSFTWTNANKPGTADIVRPAATEDGLVLPTWFRRLDTLSLSWQVGSLSVNEEGLCTLATKTGNGVEYPVPDPTDPPAVIDANMDIGVEVDNTASNTGLLPPQITELLPNPKGTGTDATDEYVELYNPNDEDFNLGGYTLQTGLSTTHDYTFPAGTILPARSFTAYLASETGLVMSNSGGQAVLLTPDGVEISATDPYGTAADGKAWALANGVWYWTTSPTLSAANVITSQTVIKLASTAKKTTKKPAAKKAVATKTAKTAAVKTASTTSPRTDSERVVRGIHPVVLALVALGAVGYGLYEYRQDLANAVHKFRTDRAARRTHRR